MRVLVTRPQPDANRLADRLEQAGHEAVISSTADTLDAALKEFDGKSADEILKQRREKFLAIGRNL